MTDTGVNPLVNMLRATAELTGTQLSEVAASMLLEELSHYEAQQVAVALRRCLKEVRGRLTLADILQRIPDGRPGADEAYALLPWDEADSALLNTEIAEAMAIAKPLYDAGDKVGARLAFREAYNARVLEARELGAGPKWFPSFGTDAAGRHAVEAQAKRLKLELPEGLATQAIAQEDAKRMLASAEEAAARALPARREPAPE
jgi:hypothetical protein